jgi:hypothetical protein
MMEEVDSTMIYCEHFCKCHNVPQCKNNKMIKKINITKWKIKKITSGQKTHEEMLGIPGHKGNVNQNHIKILSYYS